MDGSPDEPACVLWMEHCRVDCEFFATEDAAARAAAEIRSGDYPVDILGIQFADGTIIRSDIWPAYRQAVTAQYERARQQMDRATRPTREVRDPFLARWVRVDADAPDWVGR